MVAEALCKVSAHGRLAHLVNGLLTLARTVARVEFHHVYAHDGHPWNEMVDTAARAASHGHLQVPARALPGQSWLLADQRSVEWAFLHKLCAEQRSQYPPASGDAAATMVPSACARTMMLPASMISAPVDDVPPPPERVETKGATGTTAAHRPRIYVPPPIWARALVLSVNPEFTSPHPLGLGH